MKKILIIFLILICLNGCKYKNEKKDDIVDIVTSFYPIYVMTANISEGAQNIELLNIS